MQHIQKTKLQMNYSYMFINLTVLSSLLDLIALYVFDNYDFLYLF